MNNNIKQEMDKIEIPKELSERSKMGISKAKLEMDKTKRKWSFIIGPAIAALLALGFFVPKFITNTPPENPIISTIETSSVIDIGNPREVVGFSDNVFFGKVIKQVGTKSLGGPPETQFEIEVLDNIKGELNGRIKVNQQGGFEGKYLFLIDDDKLLLEDQTYLFATKYESNENWHTLVPVGGDIPVNSDEDRKELIEQYKKAYQEEIPFKF
ncbi:hypothetical protein [Neobacillus sp. NPDC093127]|uniref:hypothetical protein n=1 Tax=Neobacillus sp. NPDC093127 TaxID=3364296 RepID=UPI00381B4042